uniref:Uncharacterized protein n=1 Tax=Rhodnius prolixus TaxID=13249 RepID=T1I075_RHOPR
MKAVRKKEMGYKTAAKTFQVPRATLKDYVQSSLEPEEMVNSHRAKACRILPDNRKNFYGLTVGDLLRMAFQLAKKNKNCLREGSSISPS